MLFSEARGHKVVSTRTAETVGKVAEFVVDPVSRRVVALKLAKTSGDDILTYTALTAFGTDAVTVPGEEVFVAVEGRLAELADKHHGMLGKRSLTMRGDELGKVQDVEFDPADGSVVALHLADGSTVEGARLRGIGSYAVVVQAAD